MNSRSVERHEDMSPIGTLKLIIEPDGDIIIVVKPDPDDPMQSSAFGYTVQFCTIGSGGGRSPRTRKALIELMNAMYQDNLEDESAKGRYNDPPFTN
jgi:hypothetical protein